MGNASLLAGLAPMCKAGSRMAEHTASRTSFMASCKRELISHKNPSQLQTRMQVLSEVVRQQRLRMSRNKGYCGLQTLHWWWRYNTSIGEIEMIVEEYFNIKMPQPNHCSEATTALPHFAPYFVICVVPFVLALLTMRKEWPQPKYMRAST